MARSTNTTRQDALRNLRRRLLRGTLAVLAYAVPAISAIIIVQSLARGKLDDITIVLSTYTLMFPLLWVIRRRLGFQVTAVALLVLLALTNFLVASRGGVGVGSIAVALLAVILGAIFFGRRGAGWTLAGVVGSFSLAGWLVVSRAVPPIDFDMWNPQTPQFWARSVVSLTLFGFAIAVAQVYIVERLAEETVRLRALAQREQQAREKLERTEREREAERQRAELAKLALERARRTEALARLSGGIAHDFNNALTVMLGAADLLKMGRFTPGEVERCADEIISAAHGAAELTRQLLTLGRQQVSQPRPVAMRALLARLAGAFRRVLPSDIELAIAEPPDELTAYADPGQLERALFNLVLNARDAMPHGGKLELACSAETVRGSPGLADGPYVLLAVRDNGQGMDPEVQDRIFEPFFTTKEAGVGSGLGLATVYAFAKEARGDVSVTSGAAAGSTFTLYLPAHDVDERAKAHHAPPTLSVRSQPRGKRILVVEDRADVRSTMVRVLAKHGFEVSSAADGAAALDMLGSAPGFDLLCIDGVMPGLPTSTVIDTVKQVSPGLSVLLCSGHVGDDLLRRGIAVGDIAFLAKPFTADELLAQVGELLGTA